MPSSLIIAPCVSKTTSVPLEQAVFVHGYGVPRTQH